MKWYEVYELLQCGGAIRRATWENDEWICIENGELLNQKGEVYDICDFELKANDWEEVLSEDLCIDKLNDDMYLSYLKTKSLSILQNKSRVLRLRMISFAEKHNAIPEWIYKEGLKYYITYSYVAGKYIVEGTWKMYHPNVIYFSDKSVAEKCLQIYKTLLDDLRDIEKIRGVLFNVKGLTREELEHYNKLLESK